MADEEQNLWEPEEDDYHPVRRPSWLPEESRVIDDAIKELHAIALNRGAIRELFKNRPLYPEGDSLEKDLGYIQSEPSRALLVKTIDMIINTSFQFRGVIYRDKAALTTVLICFGINLRRCLPKERNA